MYGYENLLTVMQDPTHEEHESMLEWLGGRFDPGRFDPKRVKFDDPAHRYRLAFESPRAPAPAGTPHNEASLSAILPPLKIIRSPDPPVAAAPAGW